MNTYDHIQSKAYANDDDYDKLSGYVTGQYTTEWTDRGGTRWRTTVEIINLGKADRVQPVDPDASLGREHLGYDSAKVAAAMEAMRQQTEARNVILVEKMQQHLAVSGPLSAYALGRAIGVAGARVLRVLRQSQDMFVFFGGIDARWGVAGQTHTTPKQKKITPLMKALRAELLASGPTSAGDLAKALQRDQTSVAHSLAVRDDWFVVVRTRPAEGVCPPTRIWGVKGIHDEGEL